MQTSFALLKINALPCFGVRECRYVFCADRNYLDNMTHLTQLEMAAIYDVFKWFYDSFMRFYDDYHKIIAFIINLLQIS